MTNEEKLEHLVRFLDENNIEYLRNYKSSFNILLDLKLPKQRIAVHVGDSQEFYDIAHKYYCPFFIRDSDTPEFVIEKMQNCLVAQMTKLQRRFERKNKMRK